MSNKIQSHFWFWALCCAVFCSPCRADSIVIGETAYANVYIVEEQAMYYVKVPETGKTIAVLKASVAPESVKLSEDAGERKRLLKAFQKQRGTSSKSIVPAKKSAAAKGKRSSAQAKKKHGGSAPTQDSRRAAVQDASHGFLVNGRFVLTNKDQQELRDANPHRIFEDRKGVVLLTNNPEKYEDSDDYIERSLGFRNIEVPSRFKAPPNRVLPPKVDAEAFAGVKEIVTYYAKYYALEESLVYAVIKQESDFDPNAVSSAGARGLMQLMPGTALEMGVTDIFDPAQNIAGGCQYLSKMLDFCHGNEELAIAAYNAGPGNVKRHGFTIPPFAETQDYVRKVTRYKQGFDQQGYGDIRLAQTRHVEPGYIPGDHQGKFEVVLVNGLTEIADLVMEKDTHYFLKCRDRLRSIPKDKVREVKNLG